MKMKFALAQLHLALGDTQANLEQAERAAADLVPGTILLLPELWSSSYDLPSTAALVEQNRSILSRIRQIAKLRGVYIGGSMLEKIDGKVYNSFNLITPDGAIAASYQKIHLFRLMEEEKWMQPGNQLASFDFPAGKAGLAICYDLRFPELFRRYALLGCKLILLVAEWPERRVSHWTTLLKARAIENQVFVAAVNCVGQTGDAQYGGSSLIVDPWGNVVGEGSIDQPGLVTGEVDLTLVDEVRRRIPVFEDRRPDIYQS